MCVVHTYLECGLYCARNQCRPSLEIMPSQPAALEVSAVMTDRVEARAGFVPQRWSISRLVEYPCPSWIDASAVSRSHLSINVNNDSSHGRGE